MTRVTVERRGAVLLLGLARPEKRNAFDRHMLRELSLGFGELERDPELRVGLLFAHGDHFTAGLDLADVGPAIANGEALFPEGGVDPLDLHGVRRDKPVVAVAQGYCFTIGIELLLAADVRLAAQGTVFSQMEVQRGIMPFGGATLRFPRLGWGEAMRYLLTGERFGEAEALRIGLVQEVTTREGLMDRGMAIAESIAAQAPLAVQATRRASRLALEQGQEAALAALMDEARRLFATEDAAEGLAAFLERRAGRFQGR